MNVTCTTEAADGVWHVNAWFAIALVSLAVNAITMVLKMRDHIPGGRGLFKPVVLLDTGKPPVLTLSDTATWHLFLSHTWSTGQDQAHMIKRELLLLLKGVKVFLE